MSINSVNNSLASIHSSLISEKKNDAKGTDDANQADSSQAKRLGDERRVDENSTHSSTTLDRIKNLPEVRPDVVAAARERLESGFYGSREAAIQTAKTILQ